MASLFALTPEARTAIGGQQVEVAIFPFRVGRESRHGEPAKGPFAEKRGPHNKPNNELYLIEDYEEIFVSREHFQIVRDAEGYALEDRGSTLGTLVEGNVLGGENRGGRAPLRDGDVVVVGGSFSPQLFKFRAA